MAYKNKKKQKAHVKELHKNIKHARKREKKEQSYQNLLRQLGFLTKKSD